MAEISPHLNFSGNAEEAFNFYKSVFGGEFKDLQRYKEMPDGNKMIPSDQKKIMHIALPIGKNSILTGADNLQSMGKNLIEGNNFYILINPESENEVKKLFDSLSSGGDVTMPLEKTFWNAYFGMLKDKFGIQWMINYSYEQK